MGREMERQRPKKCSGDGVTVRCAAAALTEKVKMQCMYIKKKAVIIQTSWMKLNVTLRENTAVLSPIYGIHIKDKYNGRIFFENNHEDFLCQLLLSAIIFPFPDHGINASYTTTNYPLTHAALRSADAFEVSEKQNNPMFTKPGGNVAFTYPDKIGDSVQQVMWERIKADWLDFVILCNSSRKQSFFALDFKECTPVDCSDQENSRFVFQNITASDFVIYFRVAAGRNKNYMMNFTVAAAWDHKWFITYLAERISAAVLVLDFLLIFCITTAYHKKPPSNSYGRSNFHGLQSRQRRGEESSLRQTEEIYVNCKNWKVKLAVLVRPELLRQDSDEILDVLVVYCSLQSYPIP
ncbi:LOW QUALITY PROTEIN: CD226 antigen-like [Passerculus sandwichensis]